MEEKFHGIGVEKIVEAGQEVSLVLDLPEGSDYFDGHFPGLPILPAVAQLDIAAHFSARFFGVKKSFASFRRVKFSEKIPPNSKIRLDLAFDRESGKISFSFKNPETGAAYSSGNCGGSAVS